MKALFQTLALAALTAAPVQADMLDDILDVSVLTGWRNADGTHMAGLQFDLAPGWKTYWRQPGDAGIPPQFNWSGSQNLTSAAVIWPVPTVSWDQGMRSVGYSGRVILPVMFQPKSADAVQLQADVQIGVCSEICIPVTLRLDAVLPSKGRHDKNLAQAAAQRPQRGAGKIVCTFEPAPDGMSVTMQLPTQPAQAAAIEINLPGAWISEPEIIKQGRHLHLRADIMTPSGKPVGIDRRHVVTSLFAENSGVEYRGCVGG